MTDAMDSAARNAETKSLIALYSRASAGNTYLQQLEKMLQTEPSVHVVKVSTSKQISDLLQEHHRGLVIFSISDKEGFTAVLNALTEWTNFIRSKVLRVVGVCHLNHPQIPALLMKRGCADLFAPYLNQKALRHKINHSLKILSTYAPVGVAPAESSKPVTLAAQAVTEPKDELRKKLAPLKLASDIWLVRKEQDLRRVQGRWILDLIGPGPSAGLWDEPQGKPGTWEWQPKATAESKDFITDPGAWFYRGRKPEFVWDIGRWRFLGDTPELYFSQEDKVVATRFRLVEKWIEFAENSPQARAKLPNIIKSIENEVRFKKEGKKSKPVDDFLKKEKKGPRPEGDTLDFTPEDGPESSGGSALRGEVDEVPFNRAPKTKLKIILQSAEQAGAARPVNATPIEIAETELILEVPAGMFSQDQKVIMTMDDGLMSPTSERKMDATLKQIIGSEGNTDTVSILIDANVMASLGPIQKAVQERQEEIQNFLKAARGW